MNLKTKLIIWNIAFSGTIIALGMSGYTNLNAVYRHCAVVFEQVPSSLIAALDYRVNSAKEVRIVEEYLHGYMSKEIALNKIKKIREENKLLFETLKNNAEIIGDLKINEFLTSMEKSQRLGEQLLQSGYLGAGVIKKQVQEYDESVEESGRRHDQLVGQLKSASLAQIDAIWPKVNTSLTLIVSLGALFISISLFILWAYSRNLITPIQKLEKASDLISSGDLRVRVDIKSKNEIGRLAMRFNEMAESLMLKEKEMTLYNEKLLKEKNLASQASLAKTQFLANMNHELRTPLSAIMGALDLIGSNDIKEKENAEYIEIIKRNSDHLAALIQDVLDISTIESDAIKILGREFKLKKSVESVVYMLKPQAEQKGLKVEIEFSDDLPEKIFSDSTRLRQILINILGNAIKFTDTGKISLKVFKKGASQIVFQIQDTGLGISPKMQSLIFEPFVQEDSSFARRHGGTGLGLTLSKKLARNLGGDLRLEKSSQGQGSTFELSISSHLDTPF